MTLTTNTDNPMIHTLTHTASGTTCQIHELGATVLSFTSRDQREWLFVSRDAVLDGQKAVRGGIPLAFPIFGPSPATSTMPQHGFARVNVWTVRDDADNNNNNDDDGSTFDTADSAGCTVTLDSDTVVAGRGTGNPWEHSNSTTSSVKCKLTYQIEIAANYLKTVLTVTNTSSSNDLTFDVQALQHTYLRVDNHAAQQANECWVQGLDGYTMADKVVAGGTTAVDGSSTAVLAANTDGSRVTLAGEVDRVYTPPATSDKMNARVQIAVGGGQKLQLVATAVLQDKPQPVSIVVWNPGSEKAAAMSDFGSDQYKDMICVEPGMLTSGVSLAVGQSAVLTQILSKVMVE